MGIFAVYAQEQRERLSRLPAQDKAGREDARQKYLAYQAIDSLRRQDLMEIMDCGAYNNAVMGYLLLALDESGADERTRESLRTAMHRCLDMYGAQEAEDYYITDGA